MEYLIVSDSHGRPDRIEEMLQRQISPPVALFFAGDGLRDLEQVEMGNITLYAVSGNCDWFARSALSDTELLGNIEGHTFFLTHGHSYGVKGGIGVLIARAAQVGANIVLFGHTHQPLLQVIPKGTPIGNITLRRPMYLFNPGSIGNDGSFGTLTLRGDCVLFSHGQL